MKLLFTSDWHADAKTMGHARFGDVDRAVRQTVDAAIEQKVDAYFFLGDLCDPDVGSAAFRSVELAISVATTLSEEGITNVWMAGNHDVIEDGTGDTTLSPLRPLAGLHSLTKLFERPGRIHVADATVHALPYTATGHPYSPEEEIEGVDFSTGTHIVIGHLAVEGVEPGEETTEMPRGRDVLFPRRHFTAGMQNVHLWNGHYHRQQSHELPGYRPVHIPGSPARFTFGEEGNAPGYFLVEI